MDKKGLHLNVASGQAMSQSMKDNKEYCEEGMFHVSDTRLFKMVFKISNVSELREEFDAQINSFFSSGFWFRHIDVHCDMLFNRPVLRAIIPLLDKYGFESVRGIEPYLFCYYKKRGIRYAPIKYYYKCSMQHNVRRILYLINYIFVNHSLNISIFLLEECIK